MTTTLGASAAMLVWGAIEHFHRGKPSVLGLCSGAIAGLATITNAAGFISGASAVGVGAVAAVVSYLACSVVKPLLGYDDALDTFGVHGVGGTLGALAAALMVNPAVHPAGAALVEKGLVKGQLLAMAGCVGLSLAATWGIAKMVDLAVGLRVSEDQEAQGLDIADHNEEGYNHG